eukprot:TRINITY_DN427_c0_g1_i2.p1 TRINITY_DN427_c0_g1~~TRINITY_DN427_c0_g1_i2.p1  ORF type:complete len:552 (-),score=126.47 TRINITY_DN427_c0_g1_i2:738-2393(-)
MFSTVAKTFLSKTADALATSGRIAGDPYRLHHSLAAFDNLRNDSYPGIDGMRFCGLPTGAVLLNNNTCSVGVDTTSFTVSTPCVNCNWQDYGIRMAAIGGAPIALGILCFLASIILLFVIFCNCCVAKCAPPKGSEKAARKPCITIFAIVCIVVAGIGLVITFTGNDGVGRGVNSIAGTVVGGLGTVKDRLAEIKATMQSNNYTNDPNSLATVDNALTYVRGLENDVRDVRTQYIDRFENLRSGALVAGAIFPPAALAFGLFLFCCNVRGCVGLVAWIAMFVVIIVWFSLGVHVAVSEVTNDICYEVDLLIAEAAANVNNSSPSPPTSSQNGVNSTGSMDFSGIAINKSPLVLLMQCKTGSGTVLDALNSTIESAVNQAIDTACDYIDQACNQTIYGVPVVDCGFNYTCNESYILSFPSRNVNDTVFVCVDSTVQNDPSNCGSRGGLANVVSVSRSVEDCATRCNNTDLRPPSNQVVTGVATLRTFLDTVRKVLAIMNCQFVADAFFNLKDSICKVLTAGMKQIYSGNALQAISLVAGRFVFGFLLFYYRS